MRDIDTLSAQRLGLFVGFSTFNNVAFLRCSVLFILVVLNGGDITVLSQDLIGRHAPYLERDLAIVIDTTASTFEANAHLMNNLFITALDQLVSH